MIQATKQETGSHGLQDEVPVNGIRPSRGWISLNLPKLCFTCHYLDGPDVTVFRYSTVYGPAGRPDMSLFRFVQWISEGQPVTMSTYVDDIARGTIAGLKPLGYEAISLGSDEPVVLMEAIRLIEELTGKRAQLEFKPWHPADIWATWASVRKAEQQPGWRPKTGFEEGVNRPREWSGNREWAKAVSTWQGQIAQ